MMTTAKYLQWSCAFLFILSAWAMAAPEAKAQSIWTIDTIRYPASTSATIVGRSSAPSGWGVERAVVTWRTPTRSGTGEFSYSSEPVFGRRQIYWQAVVGPRTGAREVITGTVSITWVQNSPPFTRRTVSTTTQILVR